MTSFVPAEEFIYFPLYKGDHTAHLHSVGLCQSLFHSSLILFLHYPLSSSCPHLPLSNILHTLLQSRSIIFLNHSLPVIEFDRNWVIFFTQQHFPSSFQYSCHNFFHPCIYILNQLGEHYISSSQSFSLYPHLPITDALNCLHQSSLYCVTYCTLKHFPEAFSFHFTNISSPNITILSITSFNLEVVPFFKSFTIFIISLYILIQSIAPYLFQSEASIT